MGVVHNEQTSKGPTSLTGIGMNQWDGGPKVVCTAVCMECVWIDYTAQSTNYWIAILKFVE